MRWPAVYGDIPNFADFEPLTVVEITTPQAKCIGEAEHRALTVLMVEAWLKEEELKDGK